MPQKPLDPSLLERARALRTEGKSLAMVAGELGISQGSASNACRGIKKPLVEKVPKRKDDGGGGPVQAGRYDADETVRLANDLRKAELQESLERIESRRGEREALEQLRVRERALQSELDSARLAASGDSSGAVLSEISQLRQELSELREARFRSELKVSEDRNAAVIARLEQQIAVAAAAAAAAGKAGLTQYDVLLKLADKAENLLIVGSGKLDRAISRHQADGTLKTALGLGVSPAELEVLTLGPEPIPSKEDYELGRRLRAHRAGVPLSEEPDEYDGVVALIESRNKKYQSVLARAMGSVTENRGQEGHFSRNVARAISPGKTPKPGTPEPAVLPAESRLVKCQRCGTTFDIDLFEARQAAAGKRLFVHCANPKCGFLLDLAELLPELAKPGPAPEPAEDKSTTPKCYVAGQDGRCNSELRTPEHCVNCQWFAASIRPMVYE